MMVQETQQMLARLTRFPMFALAAALAAVATSAARAEAPPKSEDIIRRYIPASRLDAVVPKDSRGALLPIAEFEALLKDAAAKSPQGQPSGASLLKADYACRIDDDRLLIECRITVRNFDSAWRTVILPMNGLSVLESRFDGDATPPSIGRDPQKPDQLLLFLRDAWVKTLVLRLVAPLSAAGGDATSKFQLVGAPQGIATLTVPAKKRLRIDGSQLERPAADDQPATYEIAVGGRKELLLLITDRKAIDRTDAMTFASTAFGVFTAPGEATWTARTQLNVFGRPLDKLECDVPSALEITAVESPGLEAWQLADGAAGRTKISLTWRQAFDGSREIVFRGVFSPDRDRRWHVPNLVLKDVSAHTGSLLLERPAGIRLQVLAANGVRPADSNESPAATTRPNAASTLFQVWRENFSLDFIPAAKDREVQAALSTLISLNAQGADLLSMLDVETRFAPLFEVDFGLPAAWRVSSVTLAGQPARWQTIPLEGGRNLIRVALPAPLNPGDHRALSVSAHFEPDGWPVGKTPIRMALPEVRLPQAAVVEALYGVTAESDLEIVPVDVVGLNPARQNDVNTLNKQLAAFGKSVRLGFTYQDTVFQGQLEIRRLPARLSVTSIALTRIDALAIATHLEAQLAIGGGGVRDLTVRLPESAGRDLRFVVRPFQPRPLFGGGESQVAQAAAASLPIILEQKPGAVDNGIIPWSIKVDRYSLGSFVLQAEVTQPRTAAAAGQVQKWSVPSMTVVGADRESGAVGIEAADDQHVTVEARDSSGQLLERVDPIDFPPAHVTPRERLVAAFAFDRPGWTVSVAEERLTRVAMPTAVIHSLQLESIVGPEDVEQVQADAELSAVGVQSLLVKLPKEHILWAALVDGTPVQVHKSEKGHSLPLAAVDPPEKHRTIRLIYAPTGIGGRAVQPVVGGLVLSDSPPEFAVVTGSGVDQPLTVLSSRWTLHHGAGFNAVDAGGLYHETTDGQRDSLVHRLAALFHAPTPADAVWRIAIIVGITLAMWMAGAAGRRLPTAALGCLAVGAGVFGFGSLLVLSLPSVQNAREGATSLHGIANSPKPIAVPSASSSDTPFSGGSNLNFSVESLADKPADAFGLGGVGGLGGGAGAPDSSGPMFGRRRHVAGSGDSNSNGRRLGVAKEERGFLNSLNDVEDARVVTDSLQSDQRRELVEKEKGQDASFGANYRQFQPQRAAEERSAAEQRASSPSGGEKSLPELAKRMSGIRGDGLLSVAFGLEAPAGSQSTSFETAADPTGESQPLEVRFVDARSSNLLTLAIAAGVAILGWWRRSSPYVSRLTFLLFALVGPVCLRWLTPVQWLPIADGVWLGGLATGVLWFIRMVALAVCKCPCIAKCCRCCFPSAAPMIALAVLGICSAAVADEKAPSGPPTVFIPYDNAKAPLSAKNVYVPQELFLKLWQAAHPGELTPIDPPVPSLVSAAAFVVDLTKLPEPKATDGRRNALAAPVRGRLVLTNFTKDAVRVSLPVSKIVVRSAMLDGSPAVLKSEPVTEALSVTLTKPGDSVLDLEFDIPVERTGPAGKLMWDNTIVPAGLLTLKLPAIDPPVEVRSAGSRIAPSAGAEAGVVMFEIPIDRRGRQEIVWQPKSGHSGEDAPVQVQTVASATIDDAGLSLNSKYTLKIRQSGLNEMTFAMPGTQRLKRVTGRDVGGWKVDGENAARKLTVYFSRKIETESTLTIELFQPLALDDKPQAVTFQPPQPEDASRETGKLGVFVAAHLSARPGTASGLIQEDASQFPMPNAAKPVNPLQVAYRYSARPVSLELLVNRRQAETRAAVQHGVLVSQRKLRISTRAQYHIAGAPRSTLSVLLPANYLLLDVHCQSMTDYSVAEEQAGRKILTIELSGPKTGDVPVLIDGTLPRRPDEPTALVTTPRLLEVGKIDSQLGVWIDDVYVATADGLGDWKSADPNALEAELRGLRPSAMQFGFRSASLDPIPVTVGLKTQSAELSADVLSLIAVGDASVDYGLTMQWRITRAATDTLSFSTPGWLRGRLDFAGTGIRQVTSADLPGDRVKWTVSLTDPVRDAYLLTAAASLPSPADGRVVAPDIVFESALAGGASTRLETQRQFAVVVNLSRRPLSLEDPSAVDIIRREALPLTLPDQLVRQAMNIVQIRPGRSPIWLARRVETTQSLQATVTAARLETRVETDGSWRTNAVYTLRNRGQQYLPVDLSAMGQVQVLSIIVKGAPSRSLKTTIGKNEVHLIPLPPSSAADLSYEVSVVIAGRLKTALPKGSSLSSMSIELPAPHVTTPAESAEFGMPVAQTVWMVKLPEGVEASVDDSGNLTPHQSAEWELLASSQIISQLESDTTEMVRILYDSSSSMQRRTQAKNNLKQLGAALEQYQERFQEEARKASALGDKTKELSQDNGYRNSTLRSKLAESVQKGEAEIKSLEDNVQEEFRQRVQQQQSAEPQLGVSLQLQNPASINGTINPNTAGRDYIVGNSLSIRGVNRGGEQVDSSPLALDFGFAKVWKDAEDETLKQDRKAASQKPMVNSRSGLQRRLESQQVAPASPAAANAFGQQSPGGQSAGAFGVNAPQSEAKGAIMSPQDPQGRPMDARLMDLDMKQSDTLTNSEHFYFDVDHDGSGDRLWTAGAGLSLPLTLPAVDQGSLAFSKVGGDPHLVLTTRSVESRRAVWGFVEVVVALLAGAWLISRAGSPARFRSASIAMIAVLAAVAFLAISTEGRWLALAVFVVAVAVACFRKEDAAQA